MRRQKTAWDPLVDLEPVRGASASPGEPLSAASGLRLTRDQSEYERGTRSLGGCTNFLNMSFSRSWGIPLVLKSLDIASTVSYRLATALALKRKKLASNPQLQLHCFSQMNGNVQNFS